MASSKKTRVHRTFNTILALVILFGSYFGYNKVMDEMELQADKEEIIEIMDDEGLRLTEYRDVLGMRTIGIGHLLRDNEKYGRISHQQALEILRDDYNIAKRDVEKRYPWADGEVKLVLTNMSFQLGATRLAKFKKMLYHLEEENYEKAAAEMLDSKWAAQTPSRANRLAARIMVLGGVYD